MIQILIISSLFFSYSLYCIIREMFKIDDRIDLKHFLKEEKEEIYRRKSIIKTQYAMLLYLLIFHACIIYWLNIRKGFEKGFSIEKFDIDLFLITSILTLLSNSITRYFRKNRKGELHVLNYKEELIRTVNFKFSTKEKFERIAKNFILLHNKIGINVDYIKNNQVNIENLKYLKKGEIKEFSTNTFLKKNSDEISHDYTYINNAPLIIGIHQHFEHIEEVTPLEKKITMYTFKNEKMIKHIVAINETFRVPANIKHAAIFSKPNKIILKWK